jgi:FtsH-binding integral membrane protein
MRESISIWWFSGLLLLCYGIVILATGIWELSHTLPNPPVLANLHAPIWWGCLLALAGLWYVIHFRPRKRAREPHVKD